MDKPNTAFGRLVLQEASLDRFLELEQQAGLATQFKAIDQLIGELLIRSFRGERLAKLTRDSLGTYNVTLSKLSKPQRAVIEERFAIENQQRRGAWFLPESASLVVGVANLPLHFQENDRFGSTSVIEERAKVSLSTSADTIFFWSILEPLFEKLFLPFALRGWLAGTKSRDEQRELWNQALDFIDHLGFSVSQELGRICFGSGWSKLRINEQATAKQRLLHALAAQVRPEMASRYRGYVMLALIQQYYKKAKDGRAKRKQVLSKQFQPTLAGFFGGDWLAFLEYIGEQPHAEETIVTALPKPQLFSGGGNKAADIAAEHGLPVEEVEKMLASFWQQPQVQSPIEQRVALLERYWRIFDEVHARQAPGMQPLWGLVQDMEIIDFNEEASGPYQTGLYERILPTDLLMDIGELWGTVMLPRWPDRIVSEPYPHMLMANLLGPALKFWHGCGLTAWFICEGPSSRTDLRGLEAYYEKEIAALKGRGTPISPELFRELVKAERLLGPEEQITRSSSTTDVGYGVSLTISTMSGSRRSGFEKLRDIITRHRQTWSQQFFQQYLRSLWETNLREASRAYNILLNEKGKAPTLKQFAKAAEEPTNHWFGGDVGGLYASIGERCPVQTQRSTIMPSDRAAFGRAVFAGLGGRPVKWDNTVANRKERDAQVRNHDRQKALQYLARQSFWYIQLEEALGRGPELKEFGASKFDWTAQELHQDKEKAWEIYTAAIAQAKAIARPRERQQKQAMPSAPETPRLESDHRGIPATGFQQTNPTLASRAEEREQPELKKKRSWLDRLLGR